MATTLTITEGAGTSLTATGTSTTLTVNTALSAAVAADIVYSRMKVSPISTGALSC